MTDAPELAVVESPEEEDAEAVYRGLRRHNEPRVGPIRWQQLGIFLRDGKGDVVGGLLGVTFWRWLHVEAFWVREDLRGRGHGTRLLRAAEEEALRRGCVGVYLETADFVARPFYEKMGYALFGQLADCPPGHALFFLRKRLRD